MSWNIAEQSIQTLIKFIKQIPSFSAQEVIQAHVIHSILIKKGRLVSNELTFKHCSREHQ
jgi:hypothetical protein